MLTPRSKGRSPPICLKGPESLHQDGVQVRAICTDAQSLTLKTHLPQANRMKPARLANHFSMFILLDLLNLDGGKILKMQEISQNKV